MTRPERKPWLFRFYRGPDYAADFPNLIVASFGGRPDLMREPQDLGRMVPVALEIRLRAGRTYAALEDQAPWPKGFVFNCRTRCEVGEIARRLAGVDDLHKQNDQAMTIYHRDRARAKRTTDLGRAVAAELEG